MTETVPVGSLPRALSDSMRFLFRVKNSKSATDDASRSDDSLHKPRRYC